MDAAEIKKRLGRYIRTRRHLKELSQEELAERARLHPTYISRIESAKSLPAIDVLINISAALDIAPWEVLRVVAGGSPSNLDRIDTSGVSDVDRLEINSLLEDCTDTQLRLIKAIVEVVKRSV